MLQISLVKWWTISKKTSKNDKKPLTLRFLYDIVLLHPEQTRMRKGRMTMKEWKVYLFDGCSDFPTICIFDEHKKFVKFMKEMQSPIPEPSTPTFEHAMDERDDAEYHGWCCEIEKVYFTEGR